MIKYIIMSVLVICSSLLEALPVGNPSEASLLTCGICWDGSSSLDPSNPCYFVGAGLSFRVGYYGDFVYNRYLELNEPGIHDSIKETDIYTSAGYLVLNLCDRIDIFGTLGASHFLLEANGFIFSNSSSGPQDGSNLVLETNTTFSWSVGLRGTLWQCKCLSVGAEGQYFSTRPDVNRVTAVLGGGIVGSVNLENIVFKYQEWQVGLGASYRLGMFVPYAAVKWARGYVDMDDAVIVFPVFSSQSAILHSLETSKDWGYCVGLTILDCDRLSLTVEGRFAGEEAVYVNGQFRF